MFSAEFESWIKAKVQLIVLPSIRFYEMWRTVWIFFFDLV